MSKQTLETFFETKINVTTKKIAAKNKPENAFRRACVFVGTRINLENQMEHLVQSAKHFTLQVIVVGFPVNMSQKERQLTQERYSQRLFSGEFRGEVRFIDETVKFPQDFHLPSIILGRLIPIAEKSSELKLFFDADSVWQDNQVWNLKKIALQMWRSVLRTIGCCVPPIPRTRKSNLARKRKTAPDCIPPDLETLNLLPKKTTDRRANTYYRYNDCVRFWDGKKLKCQHHRLFTSCIECGGNSTCPHGQRYRCRPCGGKGLCPCGQYWSRCPKCDGSDLCNHKKLRSRCVQCGGSEMCTHGKQRTYCKKCCGGSICKHGKARTRCEKCEGGSRCEHGRLRTFCKDCLGGSICEHDCVRTSCKKCIGGSICKEHGNRRSHCMECGGGSRCIHGFLRSYCVKCGGGAVCEHKTIRRDCQKCFVDPTHWCALCKQVNIRKGKYKPHCFQCYCYLNPEVRTVRRFKCKETFFHSWLTSTFVDISFVRDRPVDGGCSRRRPDWYHDFGTGVFMIELDENQHTNYTCENKRIMELFQDFGSRPIVVLRVNPDAYWECEKKWPSCFDKNVNIVEQEWLRRVPMLNLEIQTIVGMFRTSNPRKEVEVVSLFYSTSKKK